MKTVLLVLGIVFAVLTFAGAGYVLYTGGRANRRFCGYPDGILPGLFPRLPCEQEKGVAAAAENLDKDAFAARKKC